MIGLDTNVLVRALTNDDPAQSPVAREFMLTLSPDQPGFISTTALIETWWVLRNAEPYRYSREQVVAVVAALLDNHAIVVQDSDTVRAALGVTTRVGRDLPDTLIATADHEAGCANTVTFDRRAWAIPGMVPLTGAQVSTDDEANPPT